MPKACGTAKLQFQLRVFLIAYSFCLLQTISIGAKTEYWWKALNQLLEGTRELQAMEYDGRILAYEPGNLLIKNARLEVSCRVTKISYRSLGEGEFVLRLTELSAGTAVCQDADEAGTQQHASWRDGSRWRQAEETICVA